MSKEEYDCEEFRKLCIELFKEPLQDIKKYLENGYEIKGILGVKHSPTCSIRGTMGIFMEEIFLMLENENINVKSYDIPENYEENLDLSKLLYEIKEEFDLIVN